MADVSLLPLSLSTGGDLTARSVRPERRGRAGGQRLPLHHPPPRLQRPHGRERFSRQLLLRPPIGALPPVRSRQRRPVRSRQRRAAPAIVRADFAAQLLDLNVRSMMALPLAADGILQATVLWRSKGRQHLRQATWRR